MGLTLSGVGVCVATAMGCVAMEGGVVEVKEMIGLSWTANGSKGDEPRVRSPAVGVGGTPQMGGGEAQADTVSDRIMSVVKMRCIGV